MKSGDARSGPAAPGVPRHPRVSVTELSFASFPGVTLLLEQIRTAESMRSDGSRAGLEALRESRDSEQGRLGELPQAGLTRR